MLLFNERSLVVSFEHSDQLSFALFKIPAHVDEYRVSPLKLSDSSDLLSGTFKMLKEVKRSGWH